MKEDELLSRLEMLENQLQIYAKAGPTVYLQCLHVVLQSIMLK